MKRWWIIFGILISAIAFLSAAAFTFNLPTITDGASTANNNIAINSTISSVNLIGFIFNFAGINYPLIDSSLVLLLNFNNNTALGENNSLVIDSSVYKNNGTASNISFATGKYENGLVFANESALINFSDSDRFHSSSFTISMWVNLTKYSIKQIAGLGGSTFILLQSGEIYSVGYNDQGQLGDGTTTNRDTPVLVVGNYNFSVLEDTAGYDGDTEAFSHICGVLVNGTTMCWGNNYYSQLGNGSAGGRGTVPKAIYGGYNFTKVYLGRWGNCGRLINGTLLCWGYNGDGFVGDGSWTTRSVPTTVSGGYNFTEQISLGDRAACGILTNGTTMCWGRNGYGETGDGTTVYKNVPTAIYGNYNFSKVFGGNEKTCGILTNGSGMCWGGQGSGGGYACGGGLGNNNCSDSYVPTPIYGDYNFSHMESSYFGYCSLLTNGSVLCWGGNTYGNLGDNTLIKKLIPTPISGNYIFSNITSGSYHVCGILINGTIMCWGYNTYNNLGKAIISGYFSSPTLFNYGNISSYSMISTGPHSCGLLINGTAMCWGYNLYGEVGDNTVDSKDVPTVVFGDYIFSKLYTSNNINTYGILTNGSVLSWGSNAYGQLGNGTIGGTGAIVTIPQLVLGDYNFSQISAGGGHVCGLLINGTAMCWGYNIYGQVGNGSTGGSSPLPTAVLGNYNFSQIYASSSLSCGLLINGSAVCWGLGTSGQLGNNLSLSQNIPVFVNGSYNFSQLTLGGTFTCGLLVNKSVLCWGDNTYGELGNSSTGGTKNIPIFISGDYNFSSISAGNAYVCGVLTNGTGLCWGYNNLGQLGDGTITTRNVPTLVLGNLNFSVIYSRANSNLAVLSDGTIVSWGNNAYGQLASISSFNNKIPTAGFYKGNIFGKTTNSFKIGSSFDGNLFGYASNSLSGLGLDSGWNFVSVTFNGTTGKIYKNGILQNSFVSPSLTYANDTSYLLMGNNTLGMVDELRMWNRTLSDSEISNLYKSNLKQINSTDWEFYANETSLSEGTYTYQLFAQDISGSWFNSALRSFIIKWVVSEEEISGSSSAIYRPTNKTLESGYNVSIAKNDKINFEFNNQKKTIEIKKVSADEILFILDSKDYSVTKDETIKIDLDSDGYYDIQIFLKSIYSNGYAGLEINLIHEKIPTEKKASEKETKNETAPEKKNNYIFWITAAVIVLALAFTTKIFINKRHEKKFGKNWR